MTYDYLGLKIYNGDGSSKDYVYHVTAIDDIANQRMADAVLVPFVAAAFYGGMVKGDAYETVGDNVSIELKNDFKFEFFDTEEDAAEWLSQLN